MTINQFLRNPVGKGSSSVVRRDVVIENLNQRYFLLYKKAKKLFKLSIMKENGNYYFIFKIPSETYYEDKLTYDIVIQFLPIGSASLDLTLNRYAIKVFSNSPNFVFTYAYVYNKDDLIIDFLKEKLSEDCLKKPPVIKNPYQQYGFEKSIYFALLFIVNNKLITKSFLKIDNISKKDIYKNVLNSDEKLNEYNKIKAKKLLEKDKKNKKEKVKRAKKGLPPKNYKTISRKRHTYYRSGSFKNRKK